ncbi:diguanylate cyclase [Cupriavidus sp. USMAA2-4]|uniref:diguanylate cyclase n=1 Tax=Cupriavidus malaysiensis TaxID=367825 RepID=A0ABM6F8L7_9BURK|nr:diguanylate cyclase [Cupriavidus sp. USMAA2-4]AOZ01055.1 diguanylate cyclase [Cupriavidus sp. USMAHM13]AOZ07883.1 diguanylate cyclase [Cupriavidus malaysiensis]
MLHDDQVMRECFRHAAEIIKVATGASLALVTLIDRNHQHYRGEAGLAVRPIPRHNSLCEYAIRSGGVFVVEDTMLRPEVQECMLVQEAPHARFYAAVPIRLPDGEVVGALAALDPQPRRLEPRQVDALRHLGAMIENDLKLRTAAAVDPLTQLFNRRQTLERIHRQWQDTRAGEGLGAVMIDVDWFKQYNDAYGHPAGDACLRQVSALLREEAEKHQMVAGRVGGEEFALLVGAAQRPALGAVLESVRAGVERFAIAHRGSPYGRVTLSIGGSHTLRNGPCDRGYREAFVVADRALYRAKEAGRNRVWIE